MYQKSEIKNIYVEKKDILKTTEKYVVAYIKELNGTILVGQSFVHETKDKQKISLGIIPTNEFQLSIKVGDEYKKESHTGQELLSKYFEALKYHLLT